MILHGARVALGPEAADELDIEIRGMRIHAMRKPVKPSRSADAIDLRGSVILPGLINAHDHLEFSTFPKLGRGPYPNAGAWARDVYRPDESPVKEQLAIPKKLRLILGGLKNVRSGVTTVCHHNPWYSVFERNFPVRVVKQFGWAHSLEFSKDVADRYRQMPPEWPFILHLGEGVDPKSKREIFELDALGALGPNTVLTHAVALEGRGLRLAKDRGAALIWCPSSNLFLLGRTLDAKTLSSGIPIALGSDSPLTAKGSLLDELRVARQRFGAASRGALPHGDRRCGAHPSIAARPGSAGCGRSGRPDCPARRRPHACRNPFTRPPRHSRRRGRQAEIGPMNRLPILILYPHSRCNCRCVMCDIWKTSDAREIGAADLERHAADFVELGVRWVIFSGGEPLMHSDLFRLCAILRPLGIRLTMLSTGLLLERHARQIVENLDEVIVSLDGPAAVHNRIRRIAGAFESMAGGIGELRRIRPDFPIAARCTVQRMNHRSLCETASAARELALDSISFLAADMTSTAFNRPDVWSPDRQAEVALNRHEIQVLEREIEALIASYSGFILESPEKLGRIVHHFRAHLGLALSIAPRCNAPWVSAVLESDGTVRPCFFHEPIGNASEQTLRDVLNGPRAVAFRQSLRIAENPVCRRCVCSLYLG